jgi:hypothetical protein
MALFWVLALCIQPTTRRNNPEDSHLCENIKFHQFLLSSTLIYVNQLAFANGCEMSDRSSDIGCEIRQD